MNIYITFLTIDNGDMHISNGFSFGVTPEKDDVFLYFSPKKSNTEIISSSLKRYNPDKIFCSVSFYKHFFTVKDIIDDRWILGGPVPTAGFFRDLEMTKGMTIVSGPIEHYLGHEISSDFNFYFPDLISRHPEVKRVFFNCSLGSGCYWNKCSFCAYSKFRWHKDCILRPDVEKICENLRRVLKNKDHILKLRPNTCMDTLPPEALDKLITYGKGIKFNSFIRADRKIIDIIKKYDDLSNHVFEVGLEAFCDLALHKLNKGITLDNYFELAEAIGERKGLLISGTMRNFPFMTEEAVKQSFATLDRLKQISKKYKRLVIKDSGPTLWPNFVPIEYDFPIKYTLGSYKYTLPKDSDQYKYNLRIKKHIYNIELPYKKRNKYIYKLFRGGLLDEVTGKDVARWGKQSTKTNLEVL